MSSVVWIKVIAGARDTWMVAVVFIIRMFFNSLFILLHDWKKIMLYYLLHQETDLILPSLLIMEISKLLEIILEVSESFRVYE